MAKAILYGLLLLLLVSSNAFACTALEPSVTIVCHSSIYNGRNCNNGLCEIPIAYRDGYVSQEIIDFTENVSQVIETLGKYCFENTAILEPYLSPRSMERHYTIAPFSDGRVKDIELERRNPETCVVPSYTREGEWMVIQKELREWCDVRGSEGTCGSYEVSYSRLASHLWNRPEEFRGDTTIRRKAYSYVAGEYLFYLALVSIVVIAIYTAIRKRASSRQHI